MRRWLVAGVLVLALLGVPTGAHALSCMGPSYTTPHELIERKLDGYDEVATVPPFDLVLVGTVIHVSDLQGGPESFFQYRLVTVVVAGAFGDELESPVITIADTVWLDHPGMEWPVNYQAFMPLNLGDDGLYHSGICTFGAEFVDAEALVSELAVIAGENDVPYQVFGDHEAEVARGIAKLGVVPPSTTIPVAVAPPSEPVALPVVEILVTDGGQTQTLARVALAVLVVGGIGLVWRLRRQVSAQTASASDDDNLTGDVRGV